MFYCFRQNNSGGSFVVDEDSGLTHFVIIEAGSADEANSKAEDIGIYFDGEYDCPCCGDRWYPASDYEGEALPSVYDTPIAEYVKDGYQWMDSGKNAVVHYADGRKEWY
jgi:hypothetical protein